MERGELKKIELDILLYIRDICEKNDLSYFLAYGTLLGAARHKGFIPWDDDIDIWMPRPDYEKFLELSVDAPFKVLTPKLNSDYYYEFSKVVDTRTSLNEIGLKPIKDYGVYVDIFPLDGTPNLFIGKLLDIMFLMKTAAVNITPNLNLKHKKRALLFRIIGVVSTLLGAYKYPIIMDKLSKWKDYNQSNSVGCFVLGNIKKESINKSLFQRKIKIKFENEFFDAPANYISCLKKLYGDDCMSLPPIEKRISNHNFIANFK